MATPQISVPMIVKNEHANLGRCLDSLAGLDAEIVVLDTGSTDGTQDLAAAHGARVIQSTWEHDFSRARNQAIDAARGRWIFIIDADEFLPPESTVALRRLLGGSPGKELRPAGYQLLVKHTPDMGKTGAIQRSIRLIPNRPDVRYSSPIHETLMPHLLRARLPVCNLDILMLHTGYLSAEVLLKKTQRNKDILAAKIASGEDVTAFTYYYLACCSKDLGDYEHAASTYQHCSDLAQGDPTQSEVASYALIKKAQCLLFLKRFDEAAKLLPAEIAVPQADHSPEYHPAAVAFKARAEGALGHTGQAKIWYELLLAYQEQPLLFPADLPAFKHEALTFLGKYWGKRGVLEVGVELLRRAKLIAQGQDFTYPDLLACYARATQARPGSAGSAPSSELPAPK